MKNKRFIIILLVVILLLLVPFIAMQFSNEINWSLYDFIIAAALFLATGLTVELIWYKTKGKLAKIVLSILVFLILLLIWAELAVGVLGSPFAGS